MTKLPAAFDLDEALDTLDLTFNGYIPSQDALEFFLLMRLVAGEDFEFNTPLVHYFIVDVLLGNINREHFPYGKEVRDKLTINPTRVSIMMARGLGKSTVVTQFFPVYTAIKGTVGIWGQQYFYLGLAASAQGGGRVMCKAIQSMCQDSEFCKEYFESMRFTETESEFVRKGPGKIENRAFLFRSMGVGTGSVRGVRSNYGARRPCAIFFDDSIANTAAAYSETQMRTFEETVNNDAINALKGGDKGRIVMVFTPFTYNDPNVKTITSGAFTPIVVPICEQMGEDTTSKNFRGAWVDMHSYNSVKLQWENAKKSNMLRAFNQERMLRLASEEDRMVTDDMIQWYDRNLVMKMLDGYTMYITTDFTTTSAAKSDYSALGLWAVSSNMDYYLLDICVRKQELQEQYNELFRMLSVWGKGYRSIEVGVEIDGQQKAHVFSLKEMMLKKGKFFTFARQKGAPLGREGILSKSSGVGKLERFRYALPMFQNKKVYFPEQLKDTPDMKEALKQLRGVTYEGFSTHDDFIDTVSQLTLLDVLPGTGSTDDVEVFQKDSSGIWIDPYEDEQSFGGSTVF